MNRRPSILLTNDDGIDAPGIKCVYEALSKFADLTVIAPQTNLSSVSVSISLKTPLSIQPAIWENGAKVWKINGTPADAIRLGTSELLDHTPDLIISGINQGSNAGRTILYSGTVGAVIDGVMRGIPGIALSVSQFKNINYTKLTPQLLSIIKFALSAQLPPGTLLNVNFPSTEIENKGTRLAKQGRNYWTDNLEKRMHPEGYSYFWMGGKLTSENEDERSDISLLEKGYTTLVPIQVADLTCYTTLENLEEEFTEHFTDKRAPALN